MDLPDAAQALLGLPPARFTAERDAVAARLAARGDPAAPRVRKLRRPVGLAWVLNRLARERRREISRLLDAGDEVRAATRRAVSGAGAGALRAAEQALRDQARALRLEAERILASEGQPPPAAALSRVELLLRVAATGASGEALREGELQREPEVGSVELSGFAVLAGGRTPRAGGEGVLETRPAKAARAVEARTARARERAEREARAREEREVRERRRALDAARADAARADRRASQEARRADEADRRARGARERAAAAKAAADRLHARVLELERRR
jgi:hypothetical protein